MIDMPSVTVYYVPVTLPQIGRYSQDSAAS